MRPDILNPLFAEVTALKGIGPGLAKPLERLGLARAVDVAFHLPTGFIDRVPREELDAADAGRIIAITLTAVNYRFGGSARAPARVQAVDARGNYVSLVFFGGNSGWAKKLLPLNEPRFVSGKLETYGQELQIVHPDLVLPPEEAQSVGREAVYPCSEGITSKRIAALAAQALERAPELSEWIEPSLKAQKGWPGWREALVAIHADPADAKARERLAYDEIFANQLALMLCAARRGPSGGGRWRGTGVCATGCSFLIPRPARNRGRSVRSKATWRSLNRCCGCFRAMSVRARPWSRPWRC